MAPTCLAARPTCLSCLRRIVQPAPPSFLSLSPPLAQQQTRGARMSKAEEDDLQGIPVRLMQDIKGFGRKEAIIRVKAGRMRNTWFPKSQAEYMTHQRFKELGLTEAAIGVRDRTFGMKLRFKVADGEGKGEEEEDTNKKKEEILPLSPQEILALLESHVPSTLEFARKPNLTVSTPAAENPVEPAVPRSPSLARHAAASVMAPAPPQEPAVVAIFGSVSAHDIVAVIREKLLEGDPTQGARISLAADDLLIRGLDEGEDRIKHLGTFQVALAFSKNVDPLILEVKVIAEE
ncbi:hypothetical protein F4804DRAFT_335997 [Jackrogersella minutella]|nr:hypothetical protein F4804DRAFT_335997 [Jackrogersella minutella]